MKTFIGLLVLVLFFSCSKNSPDTIDQPPPTAGSVRGNLKVFDRYGNANTNYTDVIVKVIDRENQVVSGSVNANGGFNFDNVRIGDVTLVFNKPGHGLMDSVKFSHQKLSDTLTDVYLIEELPFSFQFYSATYINGMFTVSGAYNYVSTESYMVSNLLCLSKDPAVSINRTNMLWSTGGQTNVQYIRGFISSGSGTSLINFTNAGFALGDRIYVTLIAAPQKFWSSYYDQNRNYQVLHYKVGNYSNIVSFILTN
jgi:hypothetical protein